MPSALSSEDQATVARLRTRLNRDLRNKTVDGKKVPGFKALKAYYQGAQRLEHLGIAVPDELRQFVTIVAWPRTYVDAIVSRLRPQGFLLAGDADAELWRYWQENDLDNEIRMPLTDMCVYGRGYLCGGTRPEDDEVRLETEEGTVVSPLLTVESPTEMVHEWSNARRRVTAAARFYTEQVDGRRESRITLYQPNQTRWLRQDEHGEWQNAEDPDEHNLGIVPVQPLVNRSDSSDRYGESEMHPIIGLTDACARALTNAQVATEILAAPQRWAAGLTKEDFKDPRTGEVLTAWEAYFGSVWATSNKDAKFGQYAAADLQNFKTIVGVYAGLVSGVTGLPMRYLGQQSDNPPSADGIRADESRVIGTAEEKQEFAAAGLERTMLVGSKIAGGKHKGLRSLETDWRSAATPTIAQAADAAVKKHAQGLISRRQALRDCGYTPTQISKIEEELGEERSDPTLERLALGLINDTGGAGGDPTSN